MLDKAGALCAERERHKAQQPQPKKGKVLGGQKW